MKPAPKVIEELDFEPAAFRRLCVETNHRHHCFIPDRPAAFRRLCVETAPPSAKVEIREPAAFRRLCVETNKLLQTASPKSQPPLGGCVLKRKICTNG